MPDLAVIDGGRPSGRDRAPAEQEFEMALRETAAKMLRTTCGAGALLTEVDYGKHRSVHIMAQLPLRTRTDEHMAYRHTKLASA